VDEVLQRLRQRKIVQWGVACAAAAFALIMLDLLGQRFGWPGPAGRTLVVTAAIGFAFTLAIALDHRK
jgi:hypothetical protein